MPALKWLEYDVVVNLCVARELHTAAVPGPNQLCMTPRVEKQMPSWHHLIQLTMTPRGVHCCSPLSASVIIMTSSQWTMALLQSNVCLFVSLSWHHRVESTTTTPRGVCCSSLVSVSLYISIIIMTHSHWINNDTKVYTLIFFLFCFIAVPLLIQCQFNEDDVMILTSSSHCINNDARRLLTASFWIGW